MYANYNKLLESIDRAKTVRIIKNDEKVYNFRLYPFGERGTFLSPDLISEITDSMVEQVKRNFSEFDYIVSPEPGGHTWGMLVAYRLGKPANILRMSSNEKYEEFKICVKRETAYNVNYIYFDNFHEGDRVLIIDDVISSGGTICSIADQLADMGVSIVGIQAILVKGESYKKIEGAYHFPVRFLARSESTDQNVH